MDCHRSPCRYRNGLLRRRRPTPNVILILIDDLGWTDLGCQGSKFYETPHIDRLAASGMRFTQGYSACTVCSPTRAAVMTGKYPARLHITDWIAGHKRPFAKLKVPDWTMHLPHDDAHDRRGVQGRRLRDLPRRQVAPGRRGILADHAGLRPEHRRQSPRPAAVVFLSLRDATRSSCRAWPKARKASTSPTG